MSARSTAAPTSTGLPGDPSQTDRRGIGSPVVRFGLRWDLTVPLDEIEDVRSTRDRGRVEPPDARLGLPAARLAAIRLKRPIEASGLYGLLRTILRLEVGVDEPGKLIGMLAPQTRN